MKKYTYLAVALALTTLAGCGDNNGSSRPANLLTGNDFEQIEGWNGEAVVASLTKEKAHSGIYSMRVGPGVDYSSGFLGALGKLSATRVNKIQVKAWVFVPAGATAASLVTQLMDPAQANGKPLMYDALSLDKAVKARGEWTEVEKTITLPATASPTFKLYVYLWSGGSPNVAYIDDIQLLEEK